MKRKDKNISVEICALLRWSRYKQAAKCEELLGFGFVGFGVLRCLGAVLPRHFDL